MSDGELDEFLRQQRTCRVATTGPDGPHATPLWFLWHDSCIWLYSLVRSQRWTDLARDRRIGLVVDAGEEYAELRGVEISGVVEPIGDIPRLGDANQTLELLEALWVAKYKAGGATGSDARMTYDGRHGWLRITPAKLASWDFRKIGAKVGRNA